MNVVLFACWLICFSGHPANCEIGDASSGIDDYTGKIAFLLDGDICLSDKNGSEIKPLTRTEGKVEDFRFSPDLKYLAYTKVNGMVDDVGLWEDGEEVPQTEIWSIEIVKLPAMTVVAEIEPEGEWFYLGKWSAPDKLIYYSSSGFDVSGFYQYDGETNSVKELDYQEGHRLLSADFSYDGSQMLYVDDAGLGENFHYRLHLMNLRTNKDRVIATGKMIRNQSLSHDLKSAAFVEIQSDSNNTEAIVWIYDLQDDSTTRLITLPAKTKGSSSISWSAGDSYLGLFFSPSYRPNGYIVSLADPSDVHEISGKQYCWGNDDTLFFYRADSGIFLYYLNKREEKLLINNATHPVYLKAAD